MNTAQLECFISLASSLNYMKTAEQLGLTQPAVSKQIQSLESELGAKLFNRTTRSVSLTPVGAQFLPEAHTIISTYYQSKEWISNFHAKTKHALRIGYMDPHCINLVSLILKDIIKEHLNLIPEFTHDQTDSNLSHLVKDQLDLVIGMHDAKFSDDNVVFTNLHEEYFVCVMRKDLPLAREFAEKGLDTVTTKQLWNYRQVVAIPPYLLKNYFSRGRYIVPVNDDLDNAVCSNANEAYGLVLAGFGFAFIPEHQFMFHPDLAVFKWADSPHSAFGIYRRKDVPSEKAAILKSFINNAKDIYESESLNPFQ